MESTSAFQKWSVSSDLWCWVRNSALENVPPAGMTLNHVGYRKPQNIAGALAEITIGMTNMPGTYSDSDIYERRFLETYRSQDAATIAEMYYNG